VARQRAASLVRVSGRDAIGVTVNESADAPAQVRVGRAGRRPPGIHRFAPGYEFCTDCRNRTCWDACSGCSTRHRRDESADLEDHELLRDIAASLQRGEDDQVGACRQALDDGLDPAAILHDGLIAGMAVVANSSASARSSCRCPARARAMYAGLGLLKPCSRRGVPTAGPWSSGPCRAICTTSARSRGHHAHRRGIRGDRSRQRRPPQRFVDAACQHGAGVIACRRC